MTRTLFRTVIGTGGALAQSYPSRPVRYIAPSSVGSGNDFIARLLVNDVVPAFGQQVIVDNRAGAGGNLGAQIAAAAAADGYTLFIATPAHVIHSSLARDRKSTRLNSSHRT